MADFMRACVYIMVLSFNSRFSVVALMTDNNCPVPPPCTCDFANIDCSNLNLSVVPPFYKPSETTKHYQWHIYLSYNNLKTIPSRAFENLTVAWLHAFNSGLETLAEDALWGSENSLQGVFLQYNKLTELPVTLKNLQQLNMLSVHHNPITYFNETILRNMSGTLSWFDIGSKEMTQWPSGIKVLRALSHLTIYNTAIEVFPDDAFEGLENSISMLDFEETKMKEIPRGLKTLNAMTDIMFNDNVDLTDEGFLNDSFTGMTNLSDVYISNSTLTKVPNFSGLVNLRDLSITNANITRWDRENLPPKSLLSSVGLDSTGFTKIPEVISSLSGLASFSMTSTRIRSIGRKDFAGLSKLLYLSLSDSPVMNISNDAFKDNTLIRQLVLSNTSITIFPRAVESLTNVKEVTLLFDNITCTCASMGWIKHWNRSSDYWGASGICSNIKRRYLNDYIHKDIPNCPN